MEEASAASTSAKPRTTPRKANAQQIDATTTADAPWQALHQLANMPHTPLRRASSAGPSSTRPFQRRTPGTQRVGSARRGLAVTPHGQAAQRELDLRRTGLTPGRNRRRSFVQQRETPRDVLRALSRVLAPKTLPIEHTPEVSHVPSRSRGAEDDSDSEAIERPRLSLAFGEDEDDDSLLLPPKSAGLENEPNAVEFGRRAHSELPISRLSRGSFGTVYMSDIGDDSRLDGRSEIFDNSVFAAGRGEVPFLDDEGMLQVEHTGVLRGLGLDRGRLSLASGRESGIRPQDFDVGDADETFVFNVPQRAAENVLESSQLAAEESLLLADGNDGLDNGLPDMSGDEDGEGQLEYDEDDDMPLVLDDENGQQIDEQQRDETGNLDNIDEDESSILQQHNPDVDASIVDAMGIANHATAKASRTLRKKEFKLSKHGIQYPSLPAGVIKNLATSFARTAGNSKSKLSKEALAAISQATDWFFEQASEDLGTYAGHAGRKTIEESDVVALMTRQRQLNATTTPFSLAQKYLPRELLQDLRMVPPSKFKSGRQLQRVEEEDEE